MQQSKRSLIDAQENLEGDGGGYGITSLDLIRQEMYCPDVDNTSFGLLPPSKPCSKGWLHE